MNASPFLPLLCATLLGLAAVGARAVPEDYFQAIVEGDLARVQEVLLEEGDEALSVRADKEITPLHAAVHNGRMEVANLLLRSGADIEAVDYQGATPLMYTVLVRNLDCCNLLLDKGAVVDATAANGMTPLHLAALRGDEPIVKRLLEAGADPARSLPDGRDAAALAHQAGHDAIAALLGWRGAPSTRSIAGAAPTPTSAPAADISNLRSIANFDGSRYEGEVRSGKPHGTGTLTMPDKSRYEGQWRKGRKDGRGIYVYANGDRYSGEWKDDVPNGDGTFSFANGGVVTGTWRKGLIRHAEGTVISGKGVAYRCVWENGECVSRFELPADATGR